LNIFTMKNKRKRFKLFSMTKIFSVCFLLIFCVWLYLHYPTYDNTKTYDNTEIKGLKSRHSIRFSLITSYSFSIYPEHLKEMDYCILRNLMIKKLHVWVLLDHESPSLQCQYLETKLLKMSTYIDKWSDDNWEKFHCQYRIGKQPSYYNLLQYAATLPSEYIIISNGDIIFDESINYAINLNSNQGYAISWSNIETPPEQLDLKDNSNRNTLRGSETKNSMCLPASNPLCMNKQSFYVINCWPKRLFSIDSFIFRRQTIQTVTDDGFDEMNRFDGLVRQKKYYPMNYIGSEHGFIGALTHQNIEILNACKHIKTKHLHSAQQMNSNAYKHVLYSKYGIYDINHNEMFNKELIFEGKPDSKHYKLPLGI